MLCARNTEIDRNAVPETTGREPASGTAAGGTTRIEQQPSRCSVFL